jgi:hypothetical protein
VASAGGLVFSLETAVDAGRWVLTVVFSLAVVEKISALATRSAAWHPVMLLSPLRRRFAGLLIGASLVADLLTVGLLLMLPSVGGAMSMTLTLAYTIAARDVHYVSDQGCRCFWKLPSTSTRAGLFFRNSLLLLLGALVATKPPSISGEGLAGGALLLGVILAAHRIVDVVATPSVFQRSENGQRGQEGSPPAAVTAQRSLGRERSW